MDSNKHLQLSLDQLPAFLAEDTPLYVNTHSINNLNNRDYVPTSSDLGDNEYNFDLAENIEDESLLPDLPLPFYPSRNFDFGRTSRTDFTSGGPFTKSPDREDDEDSSGLSSDSLAFTITYCSVFTITLVYVAVKLVKRWRVRSVGNIHAQTQQLAWCGHAHCSQVHHSEANSLPHPYLPYSGLGSGFLPSMIRLPHPVPLPVHATAHCNDGCDSCRRLAQPPPSYTKLFLEELPPSYGDAVAKEEDVNVLEEVVTVEESGEGVEDSDVVDRSDDSVVVVVQDDESGRENDERRKERS